jgi:hypothetical protein
LLVMDGVPDLILYAYDFIIIFNIF